MLLITSDWHVPPSYEKCQSDKLNEHIDYCEKHTEGKRIILLGDIFCALEFGWEVFEGHPLIQRLSRWDNLIIIEGNHDRKNPYLPTRQKVVIDNILFCHGHQFDLLWGWLPIHRFPIPDFIRRWYRTPAKKKKGELQDYHLMAMQIEYSAGKVAIKRGYKGVVLGHTHLPTVIRRETFTYGNSGDLVDSMSWLEIDPAANKWELKYLD